MMAPNPQVAWIVECKPGHLHPQGTLVCTSPTAAPGYICGYQQYVYPPCGITETDNNVTNLANHLLNAAFLGNDVRPFTEISSFLENSNFLVQGMTFIFLL